MCVSECVLAHAYLSEHEAYGPHRVGAVLLVDFLLGWPMACVPHEGHDHART